METIGSDPLLAYLKLTQNTVRRRKQRSHPHGFVPYYGGYPRPLLYAIYHNLLFLERKLLRNECYINHLDGLQWNVDFVYESKAGALHRVKTEHDTQQFATHVFSVIMIGF